MIQSILPLSIFIIILGFLFVGLQNDPTAIPSPMIDRPAPQFISSDLLDKNKQLGNQIFSGKITLFNVWASWCVSCKFEHKLLMELAQRSDIQIIGLNYKDKRDKALSVLQKTGNPYKNILFDKSGDVAFDFGVYGTPETYLIDQKGKIRHKQIGVLTPSDFENKFLPIIEVLK